MPQQFVKSPTEVLDYTINWRDTSDANFDPYLESGETIVTSTWSVTTGITLSSATNTTTTATMWLSGGTLGNMYEAVNTITTSTGRTAQRTLYIKVVER